MAQMKSPGQVPDKKMQELKMQGEGPMSPGGSPLASQPGAQPGASQSLPNDPMLQGNTESSREQHPQLPQTFSPQQGTISPPSVESQLTGMGGSGPMMAPSMPSQPSPQAGASSMPGNMPGGANMQNPFSQPKPLDLVGHGGSLYGHQGGLQGGGMGVPGGHMQGENDISPLLMLLAMMK